MDSDEANETIDDIVANATIIDHTWPPYAKTIITSMYVSVIILALGGNTLVCYIVLAFRGMRTVTNYFIMNLALSDILMAILCIPFSFVSNIVFTYWPFGPVLCPVVTYSQTVSVFLSCTTMVAIGFDRYNAVIFPLRPRMTDKQAMVIIAFIWIFATGISLPVAILSQIDERPDHNGTIRSYCTEIWPEPEQKYAYSMALMVLQYFFPLAVFIYTYSRIGLVLWFTKTPGEAEENRDRRINASKRKMIRMMVTVVVIYAVCWLPVHAITLMGDANPEIYDLSGMNTVWVLCHWFSMSSSCLNPIVYYWMNKKYRRGFQHALMCNCLRSRRYIERETSEESTRSLTNVTTVRSSRPTKRTVEFDMSPTYHRDCLRMNKNGISVNVT